MQKKMLYYSLLILFFGATVESCKKSNNIAPKTKTQLISSATWKFDNAKVGGTDVSAFLDACKKDNRFRQL